MKAINIIKEKMSKFVGFVVVLNNNKVIAERNYYEDSTGIYRYTNWHEIAKDKIKKLSLYYNGKEVASFMKYKVTDEFYFTNTGVYDCKTDKTQVISKTIGIIDSMYPDDIFCAILNLETGQVIRDVIKKRSLNNGR